MSFPRYEAYKDSGVEWLGEVPSHWEVKSLKRVARLITEKAAEREHPIALENIEGWSGRLIETNSEFEGEGVRFRERDILFGKLRPYLAKIYVAAFAGEAVGDFHVMRPATRLNSWFAFYQLIRREAISVIHGSTFGAKMPRVSWDSMADLPLVIPPLAEQVAIAAFLDRETAKIDALVEEQERLIALLKEKRQAVISHAVTKGLDPDAPMKDSGVEWLGEVPAHWEVNKFSRLIAIAEGQVNPAIEPYASMLLIAPNHIESGTGRLLARETASDQGADSGKYMFGEGAVIYSKIRPALAKAVIAPTAGLCSADMYPLQSKGELRHGFLLFALLTHGFTAWALLESDRVAMPKINREKLNESRLPVPPAAEQQEIEAFLSEQMATYGSLIAESESAVSLLQERRAALISAAVTGKIDVRGSLAEAEAA